MRVKRDLLTPNEEYLMDIFWSHEQPLTSIELVELTKEKGWYQEYILNMLRALIKKGMVEVCGFSQRKTQNARQFKVLITQEECFAKLLCLKGFKMEQLPKLAGALVAETGDKDGLALAMKDIKKILRDK